MDYDQFLQSKRLLAAPVGFDVVPDHFNPMLFAYQRDVARWSLKRGRAAIFSRYGTGKTPMQLEWARSVHEHTGGNVLILAPLAVAQQTVREGKKFNAVKMGRRAVGAELKESYYRQAVKNLERAEREKEQPTMFDVIGVEA